MSPDELALAGLLVGLVAIVAGFAGVWWGHRLSEKAHERREAQARHSRLVFCKAALGGELDYFQRLLGEPERRLAVLPPIPLFVDLLLRDGLLDLERDPDRELVSWLLAFRTQHSSLKVVADAHGGTLPIGERHVAPRVASLRRATATLRQALPKPEIGLDANPLQDRVLLG